MQRVLTWRVGTSRRVQEWQVSSDWLSDDDMQVMPDLPRPRPPARSWRLITHIAAKTAARVRVECAAAKWAWESRGDGINLWC